MNPVLWSAAAYLLGRAAWHVSGLLVRAPKARAAQSLFQRPLLGRWSSSAVRRLRALAGHGPDAVLPRSERSSHRRPPRTQYPALGAGGVPLAAAMQPDFDSFFGGLQAVIDAAGIALIAVGMVAIARKYLRP